MYNAGSLRKRGRVVEGSSLENCRRGNPFVSSNLTASASSTLFIEGRERGGRGTTRRGSRSSEGKILVCTQEVAQQLGFRRGATICWGALQPLPTLVDFFSPGMAPLLSSFATQRGDGSMLTR
jgi:hypothetical protein